MKKLLALLLAVTTVFASSAVAFADKNVVNVSSVDELLAAIASDTKIVLSSGEYNVPSQHFDDEFGGYDFGQSIAIDGINNLEIVGTDYTRLALDVGYLPVIEIMNSSNITFTGLTIGHNVPEYGCGGDGDCISIISSQNITINNCDLYGCGIKAVNGYNTSNVVINDSNLRDCMMNAMYFMEMSGDVEINNCKIYGNGYDAYEAQFYPFVYATAKENESHSVSFNNCEIYDNHNTEMFNTERNEYTNPAAVTFNNCNVYNNAWETAVTVKIPSYWSEGEYEKVIFQDQLPVIVDGRTLVPVRAIFEGMGYKVDWNNDTQTAVITNKDYTQTVEIQIGSSVLYSNGVEVTTDVPGQVMNGRTYLPLRAISEAFELNVDWDGDTRIVCIG